MAFCQSIIGTIRCLINAEVSVPQSHVRTAAGSFPENTLEKKRSNTTIRVAFHCNENKNNTLVK